MPETRSAPDAMCRLATALDGCVAIEHAYADVDDIGPFVEAIVDHRFAPDPPRLTKTPMRIIYNQDASWGGAGVARLTPKNGHLVALVR